MKALVLAAGFGTRLLPLTAAKSKVTFSLAGIPVLVRVLKFLRASGVDDFVVNLHHAQESVRDCLNEARERVTYSFEPEILGTAGALLGAKKHLEDEPFLLVNGDSYYADLDFSSALDFHRKKGSLATMILIDQPSVSQYRAVEISEEGRLVRIAGKPESSIQNTAACLHFPGIHILEPEFLSWIEPGFSDINSGVYPRLILKDAPVYGYHTEFRWFDLGTPGGFLYAACELLAEAKEGARESAILVGSQSNISAESILEGPLEIGSDAEIAPGCSLRRSVLADNVILEPGVVVEDSLVGDNVRLKAGSVLKHYLAANEGGEVRTIRWD